MFEVYCSALAVADVQASFWRTFIIENMTMISIVFIMLSGFLAAFIQRRSKDVCLRDFSNYLVTLEMTDGQKAWGYLRVEITGMEFTFKEKHIDAQGHYVSTEILYKFEYNKMHALVRYHDDLNDINQKKRSEALTATYQPSLLRRWSRKIKNAFKTLRDAIVEVINLFVAQAKGGKGGSATVMAKQDKHVNKMQKDLVGTIGTSFEPILERYIGQKVIVDIHVESGVLKYSGVLKEYSADFLEVMDVAYQEMGQQDNATRTADLIIPRKHGIIRHLGE